MTRKHRILAIGYLLLRLSFVLAVFVMLSVPHFGTTAIAEAPVMTMHHTGHAQEQMDHSGGVHDGINGALCAALCAGTDRIKRFGQVARFVQFALASWTIDADPVWAAYHPDPAQRPPDMLPNA